MGNREGGGPVGPATVPQDNVPGQNHRAASEDRQETPAPGRLLGERYRLVDRLGQGGMGTVWKAHDEVIARDVAVKEPRLPEGVPDKYRDTVLTRLQREAQAAARVDHPSVVGIHDVVSVDGRPWIVMELIHGRSLADVLAEGILAPAEAARIMLPVVEALTAAHEHKILHRDVKPENIMLAHSGRIVLTDFGIARLEGESPLTQSGALIGSAEYIAPERINGRVPGPASDLFSVGVLLYKAVEGFSPFRRELQQVTLEAVRAAEPPAPTQAGGLRELIMQLLRKEPDERPSAGETVSVLGKFAQPRTEPVRAQPSAGGRGSVGGSAGVVGAGVAPAPGRGGLLRTLAAALTASVVTGAVVATVLWPDDAGRTPDDWERHEDFGAALSLPADYKYEERIPGDLDSTLEGDEKGKSFRSKSGDVNRGFLLIRGDTNDAAGSPVKRARYWFDRYRSMKGFDGNVSVTDMNVNGKDCNVLTWTRHKAGAPDSPIYRKKELYYTDDDGQDWKVALDWRTTSGWETGGDKLFNKVVSTFEA